MNGAGPNTAGRLDPQDAGRSSQARGHEILNLGATLADRRERLYYQMFWVRRFEERVFELLGKGEIFGTAHGCIGQEANAAAVMDHLHDGDVVVSNHRCHGHYLIRTGDAVGLMAELMGKAGGVCGGRGGSQHLCGPNFYTNGILGSTVPIAAGMAYAEKKKQTGGIVVLFMGDGAFGEGTVYETFNMISLWKVPLLVVVENNGYAQTTPLAMNCAGKLSARAAAFDLSVGESQGSDVEELYDRCGCLVQMVRNEGCPHVEIIRTYRLCGHSKGDDFRPRSEIEAWRERDPLRLLASKLKIERREELETWARQKVDAAEALARQMPPPTLSPRQNL